MMPAQAEQIFPSGRHFAQCHASTLVRVGDGWLAAWFAGSHEKHPDTAIWAARRADGAGSWEAPRRIAKVADVAHWNPVLFADPDSGRLHLWFKVGPEIPTWRTWTATSDDGGHTWSTPRELVPGDDSGGRGPVKNKPVRLSDGAWLAGASHEGGGTWRAFVERSKDAGATWARSPYLAVDRAEIPGKGFIQPTLWESAPGRVHLLLRSTGGRVCRADSEDGGRTWTRVYQTDLPNNNSGIDLARLDGGTLVLAYNPVEGDWAARTPLSLAVSSDNGQTWSRRLDLETEPGEFSYPAIVADGPDGVAVTYTWNRRAIAFRRVSLSELPAAP